MAVVPMTRGVSTAPPMRSSSPQVAVVRQPIGDERLRTIGYELSFSDARCAATGGARATSALIVDAFGEIGLEELVGERPAWLPVTHEFLAQQSPPPLRADRVVLQVPAVAVDAEQLAVLGRLAMWGYTLALDGYDGSEHLDGLLELCGVIKVHVGTLDDARLQQVVTAATEHRPTLAATGVDDHETFERVRALGFSCFQGGYLATPQLVRRRAVATTQLGALKTVADLNGPDVGFDQLERIISRDVGLSVKLLRYVNSAFFALPRSIDSVREALTILGERMVKRWATVMALSGATDKPHELVVLALLRARMCEMLVADGPADDRESLFTVGLFSVVDALLDMPMDEVLATMPFSAEVQEALLRHAGRKGETLSVVLSYERGEFPEVDEDLIATSPGTAYRQSVAWADAAGRALT